MRLGSVYGYSNDTMRLDIMPNLFSKITNFFELGSEITLAVSKKEATKLIPDQVSNYKLLNKDPIYCLKATKE